MDISDRVAGLFWLMLLLLTVFVASVVVWGAEGARFRVESRSELPGASVVVLEDQIGGGCHAVYVTGDHLLALGSVPCAAAVEARRAAGETARVREEQRSAVEAARVVPATASAGVFLYTAEELARLPRP